MNLRFSVTFWYLYYNIMSFTVTGTKGSVTSGNFQNISRIQNKAFAVIKSKIKIMLQIMFIEGVSEPIKKVIKK